jgi:hypothetical protein
LGRVHLRPQIRFPGQFCCYSDMAVRGQGVRSDRQ